MKRLPVLLLLLCTVACAKPFDKVFIVILENTDFALTMQQPYFSELANRGAVFEDFRAIARPSQPNYIALIGGDTLGVNTNSNVDLNDTSIVDLLEENAKSWTVYAERYPGNCFVGKDSANGKYARRHVPFLSFKNITSNPARCSRIVNADQLAIDYRNNRISDFVFYVPDNDNNGHDTDVAYADKWLKRTFQTMLGDSSFLERRLFVVTFDEGTPGNPENHIYTAVLGSNVKSGMRSKNRYDLYSLLRTVEVGMDLGDLGRKDKNAVAISDVWK